MGRSLRRKRFYADLEHEANIVTLIAPISGSGANIINVHSSCHLLFGIACEAGIDTWEMSHRLGHLLQYGISDTMESVA